MSTIQQNLRKIMTHMTSRTYPKGAKNMSFVVLLWTYKSLICLQALSELQAFFLNNFIDKWFM